MLLTIMDFALSSRRRKNEEMAKNVGFVIELGVEDVARSIAFYSAVLGCDVIEVVSGGDGVATWGEIGLGDSRMMFESAELLASELPGVDATSTSKMMPRCAIVVRLEPKSRAVEVLSALRTLGVEPDTGPTETDYGALEMSFRDPDGYVVVVAGRDE